MLKLCAYHNSKTCDWDNDIGDADEIVEWIDDCEHCIELSNLDKKNT